MTAVEVENPELEQQATNLPAVARALQIKDQRTFDLAAAKLRDIADLRREIVDHHAPLKQKAHEAHKAICDAEKKLLAPVAEAEQILRRAIATWDMEQRRIEEERRREAEERARREQEEALEAAAEQAEAEGASVVEVEAILTQPIASPAVHVEPTYQKAAGVSTAKTWKARVTSIRMLAQAIADGKQPPTLLVANEAALNAMARATQGSLAVPGVEFYWEPVVRAGRR